MNPFARRTQAAKLPDSLWRGVMAFLTYASVLALALTLGVIFWNALPTFFPRAFNESDAPWFDAEFFNRNPGTLVTFEDEWGTVRSMDILEFNAFRAQASDAVIRNEARHSYSGGGILGPLVGTGLLVSLGILTSIFLGLPAAIYLSEYQDEHRKFIQAMNRFVDSLRSMPTIAVALIGLGLVAWSFPVFTREVAAHSHFALQLGGDCYLSFQGFGFCLLTGGLTLAILILPSCIAGWRDALSISPAGLREASLGIGASKWHTLWQVVLPSAWLRLLAVTLKGALRAAGATVPLMYTAALAHKAHLPWQNDRGELVSITEMLSSPVQALPYHIYTVAARIPQSEAIERMQYGSALVLTLVCMGLAILSTLFRHKAEARTA